MQKKSLFFFSNAKGNNPFLILIPRGGIFTRQLERKNTTEISFVRDGCLRDGPIDEI